MNHRQVPPHSRPEADEMTSDTRRFDASYREELPSSIAQFVPGPGDSTELADRPFDSPPAA